MNSSDLAWLLFSHSFPHKTQAGTSKLNMPRDIWPPPPLSTFSLKEYILHKWQDSKIPCRSCKGIQVRINFPVHMLDPIRKHFGYGQVWPMCSQNRAGSYIPDPTYCILFSSVFPKVWVYCAKPTQIQSGWSGQDLAKLIRSESKLVCRNQWVQFLAWLKPACYQFPTFRLSSVLPQTSG